MSYARGLLYLFQLNLLIILGLSSFSVNAQIISYNDFTQLGLKEQVEVVEMMQQFVAHAEYVQRDYMATKLQKEKYGKIIQSFNVLFQKAYANSATIIQPSTDSKNQACIYGGWISVMPVDSKGTPKGFCTHPHKIVKNSKTLPKESKLKSYTSNMTKEYKSYLEGEHLKDKNSKPKRFVQIIRKKVQGKTVISYEEADTCPHPNMIICAPSIFGTMPNGAIFCATGNNSSYNTSYLCAEGIAKHTEKDKILETLVENILTGDKTKEFNYMMMAMYDTCMCKGDTGMVNQAYAKKMFGHRTCFAWMYQSKRILDKLNNSQSCKDKFDAFDYSQSKDLATMTDWFKKAQKTIADQMKPYEDKLSHGAYFDLDDKVDQDFLKSRNDSYLKYKQHNICPLMIAPSIEIKITEKHKDPDWYIVTASFVGVSKSADDISGWNFSLKGEKGEIKDDGKPGDNKYLVKKIDSDYTITGTVKGISGDFIVPKKSIEPTITIALGEKTEDIQKVNATVKGVEDTKYQIIWPGSEDAENTEEKEESKEKTEKSPQKTYDASRIASSYTLKANLLVNEIEYPSNEVEIPKKDQNDEQEASTKKDYKIKIKKKSSTNDKAIFEATVTLNGKPQSLKDKTISWFRYNASEAPKETKQSTLEKEREEREKQEGATVVKRDNSPKGKSAGIGKTTTILKTDKEQFVYAKLTGKNVKTTKSKRLKVKKKKKEKKEKAPPKADNSNPFQRQFVQPPMRQQNMRIFQGVQ